MDRGCRIHYWCRNGAGGSWICFCISNFLSTFLLRQLNLYHLCFLSISLPPLKQAFKTDSSILLHFSRNKLLVLVILSNILSFLFH